MEYSAHDFGPDFEDQVLDVLINESDFVKKFRSILSPSAFMGENNRFLVQTLLEYFDQYRMSPSKGVLQDVVRKGLFRDKGGVIQRIIDSTTVPDVDYVIDRLMSWAKWTAIDQILNSQNGEQPREFADAINQASRIGDDLLFNHTRLDSDDDENEIVQEKIKTPWTWLNEQTEGGLEPGDLAVILTVISGGKTTAMVNIARHSLEMGKFVVYFTFEDGEQKIRRRLRQSICNMTRDEIMNHGRKVTRTVKRLLLKYGGRCEIKNLQSRRSTVEDASNFVKNIQDKAGRKVDMVITDYADRFRPQNRYNEPRHALREIFEDCKWLSRDLNLIHWTARQVNKGLVGKEIISTAGASESWGSMESPDLVIGFGRTLEDEALDQITIYTAKVRDGKDHRTKSFITDFEHQRIFDATEQ